MNSARSRIAFAGTPDFAAHCLRALLEAGGVELVGVWTQPDRPAGRGRHLQPSAVKRLAAERGIAVHQPSTLREAAERGALAALAPDLLVVAAYGLLLPPEVLAIPRLGCVNVHASLLPRWRGAAPIERAIEAGDATTGISLMQMDAGLDTGEVLLARACPIDDSDTGGSLRERLTVLGAQLLSEALPGILEGRYPRVPQDGALACHAPKLRREEAAIDWSRPALELARRVRAFNPANVCHTRLGDEAIRVWLAGPEPCAASAAPGTLLEASSSGLLVACGSGALRLTRLQLSGGRPLEVAELLNGRARLFAPGALFA